MNYVDVMKVFSTMGFGAVLSASDGTILDMNDTAKEFLSLPDVPKGEKIENIIPFPENDTDQPSVWSPSFGRYLLRCPTPEMVTLPPQTQLFVFRDDSVDFKYRLLENTLNHMNDAVTIWDKDGRMLIINTAAERLETHISQDVIGKHVSELYRPRKDTPLVVPLLIEEKKPILNLRQVFLTSTSKEVEVLSNNYPIFEGGRMMGVISVMEDRRRLEEMSKRIVELQQALVDQARAPASSKKVSPLKAKYHFNDIAYCCQPMQKAIERCKMIARSDSNVMIYGETGTGKELFAQSIHNASPRAAGPFVAINCAAIPDTLLESMLFGTEKGAYTGAEKRNGLLEQVDGGTLLLDEINSMDIALQSKLLRVIQEGTFRRVGGNTQIHVNVRLLSNINIPPLEAIEKGLLRKDLYYRLGVINITIPALRDRKSDILPLSKAFITENNRKLLKNVRTLAPETLTLFQLYDWPGNVRELQHALEYATNIIPEEEDLITPAYIPEHILDATGQVTPSTAVKSAQTMEDAMAEAGRDFLRRVLAENDGNISRTAKAMGITRQNLQHRLKKLQMQHEESLYAKEK